MAKYFESQVDDEFNWGRSAFRSKVMKLTTKSVTELEDDHLLNKVVYHAKIRAHMNDLYDNHEVIVHEVLREVLRRKMKEEARNVRILEKEITRRGLLDEEDE